MNAINTHHTRIFMANGKMFETRDHLRQFENACGESVQLYEGMQERKITEGSGEMSAEHILVEIAPLE